MLRIDETKIRGHLDEMVRSTVEQTLNYLLDAEAETPCGAKHYECSEARKALRSGHYERELETKAGVVTLNVPK
jgi:transposase-like protein